MLMEVANFSKYSGFCINMPNGKDEKWLIMWNKRFKPYKHSIKENLCKKWQQKCMAMGVWMRKSVKLKSGVLPQIQKRPERKTMKKREYEQASEA